MKKIALLSLFFVGATAFAASHNEIQLEEKYEVLFNKLNLKGKISKKVFLLSIEKHKSTTFNSVQNGNIISIIDFSKKSSIKRLAIIDLKNEKTLINEYVSHGMESGFKKATLFSNVENSHKSSKGQYLTSETYIGKHGYSLRLDGLDKSNNKARTRFIVLHGADYATQEFIDKNGYLGRSYGCPAVSPEASKDIIDTIKEGTFLYIYN